MSTGVVTQVVRTRARKERLEPAMESMHGAWQQHTRARAQSVGAELTYHQGGGADDPVVIDPAPQSEPEVASAFALASGLQNGPEDEEDALSFDEDAMDFVPSRSVGPWQQDDVGALGTWPGVPHGEPGPGRSQR